MIGLLKSIMKVIVILLVMGVIGVGVYFAGQSLGGTSLAFGEGRHWGDGEIQQFATHGASQTGVEGSRNIQENPRLSSSDFGQGRHFDQGSLAEGIIGVLRNLIIILFVTLGVSGINTLYNFLKKKARGLSLNRRIYS
ncbi:MAG: hypothetical protein ACPL3P_00615 [Anaerolineales bacterium]